MNDDWARDTRIVRRVAAREPVALDSSGEGPTSDWAAEIPAVKQLLRDGLELAAGVNVFVGENGAGKSTVVEAIAMAFGLAAEGGSRGSQHRTRSSESGVWRSLQLHRTAGAPRWGYFLRAETMHSFYTYLERDAGGSGPAFHEMSHGESFLEVLHTRFDSPGFYCLDEPEAALSFTSQLALVTTLVRLAEQGSQAVCATHSPILAAIPGATIWEFGAWGMRPAHFEDLQLVLQWQAFLADPQRFIHRIAAP